MTDRDRAHVPMGWAPPGRRKLCAALLAGFVAVVPGLDARADEPPVVQEVDPAQGPGFDLNEPLPADPLLWDDVLENGLVYAIRPTRHTEGQVILRLLVRAGSLYEADGEEGAAHLTSQTLFATALRGDAGRAISEIPGAFASLSYRSRPAMIDFESASFTVRIPTNDSGTLTTALRFLREIAGGRGLGDDALLEAVQPEIVEATEAQNNVGTRMRQQLFPKIFAGTPMANHPPFCPVDELCLLGPEALRRFHDDRYRPSEMAVLIVGDVDLDMVEPIVRREFEPLAIANPARALAPVAPPRERGGAVIISDPDLTAAIAEISFVSGFEGGVSTLGDLRRILMQRVVAHALGQRLRQRIELGQADYIESESWIGAASGPIEIAVASVQGDPIRWRAMVDQLANEVASLSRHGMSERELDDSSQAIIAELAQRAAPERGASPAALMHTLAESQLTGAVVLGATDRLELSRMILKSLDVEEINALAARRLSLDQASLLLLLPVDAPGPPLDALALAARSAFDAALPFEPIAQTTPTILARKPQAGDVVTVELDPTTGVTSAWLSSGVRIHHSAIDAAPGRIAIVVTLAGGQIQEDDRTRGLTAVASAAFSTPASSERSAVDLRQALVGRSLRTATRIEDDRIVLRVEGAHEDIELAFQLIHLWLTDPILEGAPFESWRWKQSRHLKRRASVAAAKLIDLLAEVRRPRGENHERPLTLTELDALTRDKAQRWLEQMVRENPVEVAIAGDVSRAEALDLTAVYLASITPRPRICPVAFCERRNPGRPMPHEAVKHRLISSNRDAAVLLAIHGADELDRRTSLILDAAARVLANRIDVAATQRRRLATNVITRHEPGVAFPDSGLLFTFAITDVNLLDPLMKVIDQAYDDLAQHGPTEAELDLARAQMQRALAERQRSPLRWAERLATLEYRGTSVADLLAESQVAATISANDVKAVVAEHDPGAKRRLRLMVVPEAPLAKKDDRP